MQETQAPEVPMTAADADPPPATAPPLVGNPFPVYPVASLRDITDIRAATVITPEVATVCSAVETYIESFNNTSTNGRRHLVLAAKGDFGSGKTHLMRFARSDLEHGSLELKKKYAPSSPATGAWAVCLSVAGSEAPIEDWYASVLGPALAAARPRDVIRDLMVDAAAGVALRDPFTKQLAEKFKRSPQTMFEVLRSGDEIDTTEVERQFAETLERLCPHPNAGLPSVLSALPNAQTSRLAEQWLAGERLSEEDRLRIGAPSTTDRATTAMVALCAIASACRRLGRPFALFIDELEHLVRYDRRNQSRRNLTWIKRLVESLVEAGAMVFVCGHWEAWEQQGDFLDRFMGRPTIQLVRLSESDVLDIVKVCAPGWTQYFSPLIARAVIEATSGNIRRVMTVLYDLYADEGNRTSPIPIQAVHEAALRRLDSGTIGGVLPTMETAARSNNATVERDAEILGESFDAALKLDDELRLVVRIVHGRDEGRLLAEGEKFADTIRFIRTSVPHVRGMFVALGAVNSNHLHTLDAARSEMDVLNAEAPDVTDEVVRLTVAALQPRPAPDPEFNDIDPQAPREMLSSLRGGINAQALAQSERAQVILGDSDRGRTVYGSVSEDDTALLEQQHEINERVEISRLLKREAVSVRDAYFHSLLGRPLLLVEGLLALLFALFPFALTTLFFSLFVHFEYPEKMEQNTSFANTVTVLRFAGLITVAGLLFMELSRFSTLERYRQYRVRLLEDMRAQGASLRRLISARAVLDRVIQTTRNLKQAPLEAEAELKAEEIWPRPRRTAKRKK